MISFYVVPHYEGILAVVSWSTLPQCGRQWVVVSFSTLLGVLGGSGQWNPSIHHHIARG